MTKVAAMSLYGKNLKKYLLRNQNADDLETSYAARDPMMLIFIWSFMKISWTVLKV